MRMGHSDNPLRAWHDWHMSQPMTLTDEQHEFRAVVRQFVEAKANSGMKGIEWPLKRSNPQYEALKEEYDTLMSTPQAVVDTLVEDYKEGVKIGQYDDSDLEYPPTEKEIETAAVLATFTVVALLSLINILSTSGANANGHSMSVVGSLNGGSLT